MTFPGKFKLYIFVLVTLIVTILLILNEFILYGIAFLVIAMASVIFWKYILSEREEKISGLLDELEKYRSETEKLKSENEELKHRRLNISELRNIFDLGLMQVNSSFTRTWNDNFEKGSKTYHFIGALKVTIVARYGLDLKKIRLKKIAGNNEIWVSNITPKFLAFNDVDYKWEIAELLEFREPWLGADHWRKSEELKGFAAEIKEKLQTKTHREVKSGPEELDWIIEPLRNQIATTLQLLIGSSSVSVKLTDDFDDSFKSLEEFSSIINEEYPDAGIIFEEE